MPQLLFVYGTLHPNRSPAHLRETVRHFREIGPATIPGILHDLGEYPAVTPPTQRAQKVQGTLFELPKGPTVFPTLDAYEGFDPASPATSLFVRVRRTATLPNGKRRRCSVYLYNQPITETKPTAHPPR